MNNLSFILKTKVEAGSGAIDKIKPFLIDQQYRKIGFITDQALSNNASINQLKSEIMADQELAVAVDYFYNLPFEPDYDSLDLIKFIFKNDRQSKVDVIVVFGGGSAIDFAKGIATLITNHEPAISYRGFPKQLNPSIPVIAVPSTAGTASEVTFNAVFINKKDQRKLGINTHNNFPVLAVLDPSITKGCPYPVALSSGLDALVHTLESFAARQHTLISRIFATEAFRLIIGNIEKALSDNKDDEALLNMQMGAYLAGISLMNAGSGPAGAISYPLGVIFSIPHGIAGGVILPFLVQHNIKHQYQEYGSLFSLIPNSERKSKSTDLAEYLFSLFEDLRVWNMVKKIDDTNTEFRKYIEILQGAFDQNPVAFSPVDAFDIISRINKEYLGK